MQWPKWAQMEVVLKLSGREETYERMGARDQVVSGVLVVIKKKEQD